MEIYKAHRNMIQNIFELLDIAKKNKARGRYIDIALGINKYPENLKEAVKLFNRQLWKKDK